MLKNIGDYYKWMGWQVGIIRGDYTYNDIPEGEVCDFDDANDVEERLREALENIVAQTEGYCCDEYYKREKKNLLSTKKTRRDILMEMQEEAKYKAMNDETFGDFFISFINSVTLDLDLFSVFRKLYMRSGWESFLEACIKYKWCQDEIAELNKEEEKAKFESISEEDMDLLKRLKGYIDKVSEVNEGKLWKSPFDGEKAKDFIEECFFDSEMGEEFRSFCKKGDSGKTGERELVAIANVLGYLMSKGKLDAKHKDISEAITGNREYIEPNLKNGKGYDNPKGGGSKDFKEKIVPFMNSKLE